MKILIISEFFPTGKDLKFSGGVESRNYFVAKNLSKKHNVTTLTSRLAKTLKTEIFGGFKVVRVGPEGDYKAATSSLPDRIKFIKAAIKEGRDLRPDIVEGTNFITHFIAKRIATSLKIPSIAWYPDVWVGQWLKNAGPIGLFGEVLERFNLNRGFNTYIAISQETQKKLKKRVSSSINVIPCGVDLGEFEKNTKKLETPTIICISRLSKYKNVKELMFAFALLTQENEAKLVIVGRGPEEKSLRTLSKVLKIDKNTKFLSNLPRKELISTLSSAYIFCLPSTVEGFGIAIIEAAAAKVPFVIPDTPVFREITKNGKGGLMYKSHNILDLKEKLEFLLGDKTLYSAKAKEGIELAAKYDWAKIAKDTEKIYIAVSKKR